jgi:pyruvate, water dikinase
LDELRTERCLNKGTGSGPGAAIYAVKAMGKKIGICGQAPSDYPEFARFLVEQGIDSISLNPDAVMKTTVAVLDIERTLPAEREEEQ